MRISPTITNQPTSVESTLRSPAYNRYRSRQALDELGNLTLATSIDVNYNQLTVIYRSLLKIIIVRISIAFAIYWKKIEIRSVEPLTSSVQKNLFPTWIFFNLLFNYIIMSNVKFDLSIQERP